MGVNHCASWVSEKNNQILPSNHTWMYPSVRQIVLLAYVLYERHIYINIGADYLLCQIGGYNFLTVNQLRKIKTIITERSNKVILHISTRYRFGILKTIIE